MSRAGSTQRSRRPPRRPPDVARDPDDRPPQRRDGHPPPRPVQSPRPAPPPGGRGPRGRPRPRCARGLGDARWKQRLRRRGAAPRAVGRRPGERTDEAAVAGDVQRPELDSDHPGRGRTPPRRGEPSARSISRWASTRRAAPLTVGRRLQRRDPVSLGQRGRSGGAAVRRGRPGRTPRRRLRSPTASATLVPGDARRWRSTSATYAGPARRGDRASRRRRTRPPRRLGGAPGLLQRHFLYYARVPRS